MRTFVLMGQGGRLTSPGMVSLANRLPNASVHSWDDGDVLSEITHYPNAVAVVGYSLGANQLGWLSAYTPKRIALGVAYDPSWLSPLVKRDSTGRYFQTASKFDRLLCYRNVGAWVWGGSSYVGRNVEETKVSDFHLGIQFNESLHLRTIAAVKALGQ